MTQRLTAWNICWSVTYFCTPVIKLNILKTIWCRNVHGIMNHYGRKIDLIINVQVNDQYFIVHWCLPYIFKRIWWMIVICGVMDQCDTDIDLIIVCRSVTYNSWWHEWFLSRLLVAGCDIGVRISVRSSACSFVRSSIGQQYRSSLALKCISL